MHEHVHRIIVAGSTAAPVGDASASLVRRLRPDGFERYTGLILFTPDVRLAVLEGPASLQMLHRHALMLAGLADAQTLLAQRTSFRWFSALLLRQHEQELPGFSLTELAALATLPPRRLCSHVELLAGLAERNETPARHARHEHSASFAAA